MSTNPIRSFKDLDVYKTLYKAAIIFLKEILPKLPEEEKYNLKEQGRRACMAPLAIIAEGYAKKHQKRAWKKYLEDALGERNEMITHLSLIKDLYSHLVDPKLCDYLIEMYDISGKQLYRLGESWTNFKK
ncbi:MAG: four helix bundle protein [Patescibacteria group bacterium]